MPSKRKILSKPNSLTDKQKRIFQDWLTRSFPVIQKKRLSKEEATRQASEEFGRNSDPSKRFKVTVSNLDSALEVLELTWPGDQPQKGALASVVGRRGRDARVIYRTHLHSIVVGLCTTYKINIPQEFIEAGKKLKYDLTPWYECELYKLILRLCDKTCLIPSKQFITSATVLGYLDKAELPFEENKVNPDLSLAFKVPINTSR